MKEYPILFSAPMVRALLANRKFVTRRLSKQWLKVKAGDRLWVRETLNILDWEEHMGACVQYAASVDAQPYHGCRGWTHHEDGVPLSWGKPLRASTSREDPVRVIPSIHMPRWASRITLEATEDAHLERLQDITEADAEAEGVERLELSPRTVDFGSGPTHVHPLTSSYVDAFKALWSTLHTKPGERWEDNPELVRVGAFRRIA